MDNARANGLFIGLGFQKCATTQITRRLSGHPAIWPHPVRELRYWNTLFRNQKLPSQTKYLERLSKALLGMQRGGAKWAETVRALRAWSRYADCAHDGPDDYLRLFEDRPPTAQVFGEISPNYASLSADRVAEIYERLNRPRMFVIMREPVARVLSQINHEARLRPENVDGAERQLAFLESRRVREMSDYPKMVEALRSIPDQDNVGMFFFEDFVEDMPAFFKAFCGFLGVPYHPALAREMPSPRKRKGDYASKIAPEAQEKAADLFSGMAAEVEKLTGRTPDAWKIRRIARG
jgi:hypothetical protein